MNRFLLALSGLLLSAATAAAQVSGVPISGLPPASPLTMQPTDFIPVLRSGITVKANPYTFPASGNIVLSTGSGVSASGLSPINGNCVTGFNGVWSVLPCTSGIITGSPITGNLTKFASASTITNTDLSGDVTTNGTSVVTLNNVNSNVGTFGSSTAIPNFTVGTKGLITAAGQSAVVAPAGTLTGTTLASNVTGSSLTGVGTLTGGATGAGFTLALSTSTVTGTLPSARLPSPFTSGTASGNTSTFATSSGTLTNGHCVQIDSSGNFVDAGGTCTVGGGGGTVNAGTAGQVAYYASSTNAVSGESLSALLDSAIGSTQGDILYRGASAWSVLAPSTSGFFLQTQGASANPQWAAGNAGTVTTSGSPASGNLAKFSGSTAVTNGDLTGDLTTSGTLTTTLATVNSNVGSFGSSTAIPNITVNGKGLVTAAGTNAVIAPAGTLTGSSLASGVTSSSLTSFGAGMVLGTPTSGTMTNVTGLPLSTGVTGTLQATNFPALTGDITTPGGSLATTLATVNPNVGTYNGLTVNAKGLVTGAVFTQGRAVLVATTGNLNATYSNGSSGVGATLTNAGTQAAIVIDGVALTTGARVLVWQQTTTTQDGIYTVTTVGSGSTNWVLTRATDFDNSTTGNVYQGATVPVVAGTLYTAYFFIETGLGPFTVGTTPIIFSGNSSINNILPNGNTAATIDVRNPLYGAIPDAKKLLQCAITSGTSALSCSDAAFVAGNTNMPVKIYDVVNNAYVFRGNFSVIGSGTTATLSGNALASCVAGNCETYYGTDNTTAINAALAAASTYSNSVAPTNPNFIKGGGAARVVFPIDSRGDGYLFTGTLNTACCNVVIDADAILYSDVGNTAADRVWAMNLGQATHIKKLIMNVIGGTGITMGVPFVNSSSYIDNLQLWGVGTDFRSSQPALTATVVGQGTSGWNIGDTITLTGGTCSTQPILTVTAVSGGKVTAANVTTLGACTVLASNPVSQGSRTGSGVGTTTWTMTWGLTNQVGLQFLGYDLFINRYWLQGGSIGFSIQSASDVFANELSMIGSTVGVSLNSAEDVHLTNLICDTNSLNCMTIDGSHSIYVHASSFTATSFDLLTTGIQVGGFNPGIQNTNLFIEYQSQYVGGTCMSVAHTQNSTFKLNCSNDQLFAGQGANITTGVAYGSGNAGSLLIDLNQDPTITTNYTGTITGVLRNTIGGAEVDYSGSTFTIASGCGTPGSLTGTPTTGSFTAGQAACAPGHQFTDGGPRLVVQRRGHHAPRRPFHPDGEIHHLLHAVGHRDQRRRNSV